MNYEYRFTLIKSIFIIDWADVQKEKHLKKSWYKQRHGIDINPKPLWQETRRFKS